MKVKVLFFASCKDITGQRETCIEIHAEMTVGEFKNRLLAKYPDLEGLNNVLSVAVNAEYTDNTTVLHDGDEVAFIPPVSGGINV